MNSLKNFTIVLIIFISFNSCCKSNKCKCAKEWGQHVDDCSPKDFGPYPLGATYDYLYFERGSWWIYRNSLTGETDSIYITSCDTEVVYHAGQTLKWQSVTYTAIHFTTRSDIYNTDYDYYSYADYPDITPFKYGESKLRSCTRNNVPESESDFVFHYPFPETNIPGYFEYYPILNIQGIDYTEVAVFEVADDYTVQMPKNLPLQIDGPSKYYWAKGYGLVMLECMVYNNATGVGNIIQKWELIKSNLIH